MPPQQREKELEIYGPSGNVTSEGRPMYFNNFGGESSENTIGVIDPRINNNALTHIPSIYDGRILNEKDAIQRVVDANGYDQITGRFIEPGGDPSARSKSLDGKYMGMQGGFNTRREQPQQTRRKIMPQYPFNNSMQGGAFGPQGGLQNIGGGLGGGQMSDRDLQLILEGMRSKSPTGGALPNYDSPGPAGGPPPPQGVPGLGTTGIDPRMIDSGAGGGLDRMDFGAQDIAGGMQDTQEGLMSLARQNAQAQREAEMLKRLLEAAGGTAGGMAGGMGAGGIQPSPGMGTTQAGAAFNPSIPMSRF